MGNLQGSEGKQPKTGKSPGKGKNLIKNLGNKKATGKDAPTKSILRKKSASQCSTVTKSLQESMDDLVTETPAAEKDPIDVDQTTKKSAVAEPERVSNRSGSRSSNLDNSLRQQNKANVTKQPAKPTQLTTENGLLSVAKKKEISPPSKESSSESVFTDPLTPGGFAAELNAAYYSEESVTATPDEVRSTDVVLHVDSNLRRHESRLEKLSVSKISRVSLDDRSSEDLNTVFLVADTMPDACADNGAHSMDSGLGSRLPTQIFNGDESVKQQQHHQQHQEVNDSGLLMESGKFFIGSPNKDDSGVDDTECDFKLKGSTPVTSFTLSRHRKVEIPPSKPTDTTGMCEKYVST